MFGQGSRLFAMLESFILTYGIESSENVKKMKTLPKKDITNQLVQIENEKSALERSTSAIGKIIIKARK